MTPTAETLHIAGLPIRLGDRTRQRCGWCGATLLDIDLTDPTVAPQVHHHGPLGAAVWSPGTHVALEDGFTWAVEPAACPGRSCLSLDPTITT